MSTIYLARNQVPAHLLDGYRGNEIRVTLTDRIDIPASAGVWDGGTREIYTAVRLCDGATVDITDTFSAPWDARRTARTVNLRPGFAILRTGTWCGKNAGLHFYMVPADAAPMLPAPTAPLSRETEIVLDVICGFKSSFRNDEYHRKGLSQAAVETARDELLRAGLVTKVGAATPAGRNARVRN